ncbi:MAG: hypothetical protein HYT78_12115, partial [Deltaproteobacteria bacterium]|nr:hypothetical protein [Deltaproteobacteria bacterium]
NIFTLGVAYQSGLLPLEAESIEAAIRLNGLQVEQNLRAFRYGRLHVAQPERVREITDSPRRGFEEEVAVARSRLSPKEAEAYDTLLNRCANLDGEARRMVAIRIAELIEYQNRKYAAAYVDYVLKVAGHERARTQGSHELTHAVIRYLYKLMAYKDEYEVARLHLKPTFHEQARTLFTEPVRLTYHLHPPLLRALGLKRKLAFGPWFTPVLRSFYALRWLRRTPLDIFGYAKVRREERQLITWYKRLVDTALGYLAPQTHSRIVEIAQLPDEIRGYERIKLNNLRTVKEKAEKLLASLSTQVAASP